MQYEEFIPSTGVVLPSEKLKTDKIALLDADYIKYHVTAAIHKKLKANAEMNRLEIFVKEDPAITETKRIVDGLFEKIDDPILFCFSGSSANTFRAQVAFEKEYKGNRKKDYTDYDGKMQDIRNCMAYIQENYVTLIYKDLEADDVVTMLQCENTYIMSNDKDLKQVPGFHYDWSKNNLIEITNAQAAYNLAYQMLVGDTTDNIPGLPGCGPKGAIEILSKVQKPAYYLLAVMRAYQNKFGSFNGADMFAETWMLVKMRTNRGKHFCERYQGMFDLKESLLNQIKLRKS